MDDQDEPPIPSKRKHQRQIEEEEEEEIEEDYMSDKLLRLVDKQQEKRAKTYAELRKEAARESERLQEENKKMFMRNREEEARKEGLSKALTKENKGFQLLQKMGFVPGSSLGKAEVGLIEPIAVDVRTKRYGLGATEMVQERVKQSEIEFEEYLKDRDETIRTTEEQFHNQASRDFSRKHLAKDLKDSMAACEVLDKKKGVMSPYWLSADLERRQKLRDQVLEHYELSIDPAEEPGDGETGIVVGFTDDEELLRKVTAYLRETHFYCQWCGVEYNDEEDLSQECPGDTREDH